MSEERALAVLNGVPVSVVRAARAAAHDGDLKPLRRLGATPTSDARQALRDFTRVSP